MAASAMLVVLGAGAWVGGRLAGWFGARPRSAPAGAAVQRGPLRIAVIVRGNLKAAESASLKSEVEGRTTILELVPEGTQVKRGDIVCKLDASALVDSRLQQTIAVGNAEAALVKASQNREIQDSQNRSDIAQASQQLEFARQDLQKFLEGEREAELEKARQAIDLAREEAARAADRLSWSEKLVAGGFLTATELDADRIAEHRAQVEHDQAKRALDLLERFQLPRTQAQLRGALEEAEREQQRVELQAVARLVDYDADVRASQARFGLESEKLAKLEAQIEKASIRAPCDGLLVYSQLDDDEPPIQEGGEVWERQEILSIPNAAGMIAEAKLHESVLEQVRIGQPCVLTLDALPGRRFEGRVIFVAVLPDQNSRWSNPNTRVYRTHVEISSADASMRPGMTCAIEILIEELADTLHVPVQAVFRTGRESVCFVSRGGGVERRAVRVGRYNELWVQVLEGLAEGEVVLLSPPPGHDAAPGVDSDTAAEAPSAAGAGA